ncbi:class I SAM-dependent methyltransferase [Phytomonospora endophytica]|uniref:SAM-dependent methyltransferase n=1 Tax=Phytomonospora endophytica TaxID=714109 RepID=A0A841FXV5_9ACTN|nr:class I SAM-dependent methyltransferase [Phytomonospora endophytica]MBB6037289.1 SAM-dependent methyltransferase [Phytomonospora endophytica]GIG69967.1 methyltransferase [Phytomonospora endophytica]
MSRTDSYTFSNSSQQSEHQLDSIQRFLDPLTTARLAALDLPDSPRCLELGPGAGSIAYWLADRGGSVTAVDLDPGLLREHPGVTVVRADVRDGLPAEAAGPFDLIHARLLLVHLPTRREIVARLVEHLAPGGYLVIGEFAEQPLRVYTAPDATDGELFVKVLDGLLALLAAHGGDMGWAHEAHGVFTGLGLTGVHSTEHAESWTGGSTGARLYKVNIEQKWDALLGAGFTVAELERFVTLTGDPAFSAPSYRFTMIAGRKA